jgi:hypothetical protein
MIRIALYLLLSLGYIYASEHDSELSYTFSTSEAQNFQNVGFRISSGSINIKSIGKFADGDYALDEATIEPAEAPNTYTAQLRFKTKKGMFSYSHIEKIGILYDGQKLWIKYRGKVYKYSVPATTQTIDRQSGIIIYKTKKPSLDVEIEKMKLRFEF